MVRMMLLTCTSVSLVSHPLTQFVFVHIYEPPPPQMSAPAMTATSTALI